MRTIRYFASIAEAVAHYYANGYESANYTKREDRIGEPDRIMKKGLYRVYLFKLGLLEVEAIEVQYRDVA